jgi:hypothetical protein
MIFQGGRRGAPTAMEMKVILLIMSANCVAFRTENLVDIVTAMKRHFHSECVYLLQNQEAGKCSIAISFDRNL